MSNLIWALNLALEFACLGRWVRVGQASVGLICFVTWQLLSDVVAVVIPPMVSAESWSLIYWALHAVTYVLLAMLLAPRRLCTISSLLWLAMFTGTAFSIITVWNEDRSNQFGLGYACAGLMVIYLFCRLIVSHRLRWVELAAGVWSIGQLVSAQDFNVYGVIYPATCATALAMFLFGEPRQVVTERRIAATTSTPVTPFGKLRLLWN